MFVTTIERTTDDFNKKAIKISEELNLPFVVRNRVTVKKLMNQYQSDCLVVGNDLVFNSFLTGQSVFFHPNFAQVRLKRYLKGEMDSFLDIAMIEPGDHVLDCTLGFASDAILASVKVGENGSITGLENNKIWAYILKQGLKEYETKFMELKNALNKIRCLNMDYEEYLLNAPNKSYDIVYFDPMFEQSIEESNGLNNLKIFASNKKLTKETIYQAIRVARKQIILKAHYKSPLFEELGFKVFVRKSSKFHFGVIKLK
ncbi:MAG: Protein-L-isoD(D-D) O-methyltransferase [Bacillales bacterium]|jgi:16S rRNA G966 N2-methylase RsmD|nr:Protein-L-isoD(D-D) O-methyltransferase [Bacillales bacterium]